MVICKMKSAVFSALAVTAVSLQAVAVGVAIKLAEIPWEGCE